MRESMEIYPRTAAEREMNLQEVLSRAATGKIKWWQFRANDRQTGQNSKMVLGPNRPLNSEKKF